MQHLLCEIRDEVAEIRLNRPEVHNAFNDVLIDELTGCFRALAQDNAVRVVVLSGEGPSFCAGADLNWMGRMKDYSMEQNLEDSRKLAEMFHTINALPKPLIGKVQGAAMGGGVGLVAVCDFVLAMADARFGLTEVQLGLVPAVISPFVVAKMGESHARAWFLSGDRFSSTQAEVMGLVHDIANSEDEMEEMTRRKIRGFLRAAPRAAAEAKALIADVQQLAGQRDQLIDHTSSVIARLRVSEEGQLGMTALLNKQKPAWNRD